MKRAPASRQRAFSLIEVLVSIVIVGAGILGTLALLLNSLRLSTTSNYRSIAAEQAAAMAETIRANPLTIAAALGAGLDSFAAATPAQEANCLSVSGCDRSAFVRNNIAVWQEQLARSLPAGTGAVCRDSTAETPACDGAGQYVVRVCWNEQRIRASSNVWNTDGEVCTWTAL